jgi:glycosyltransferase involved in cell wall biosynthesis
LTLGVVIAVRDQAAFLGEALDSISAQTRQPDRVIVVDDSSTDGTGDVARARGFEVVLGPGKGPAVARNIGVAAVGADVLGFLDGDDRYVSTHHELLLAALEDGDVASGYVRQLFDGGRESELAAIHEISEEPMKGGVCGAVLIRRSAFEAVGGFPEDDGVHDFFGLIGALHDRREIDEIVLERRIHGANRTLVNRDAVRSEYLRSARAAILASRRSAGEEAV